MADEPSPAHASTGALDFRIAADAYELRVGGQAVARLAGGCGALLQGAGEHLREVDIEAAIERAEDWLMPASRSFQGLALHVTGDRAGLRERLGQRTNFTPDEVERAFSTAADDVAFRRPVPRELIADLVLLRELVHHGRLSRIVLL